MFGLPRSSFVPCLLLVWPLSACAQQQPISSANSAKAPRATKSATAGAKDPNRQICEEFNETGSRLAGRRICMTAAEWAAQRQLQRDEVEKSQKGVNVNNPG